ncbi:hypothetical protein OSH11_03545 [Kaistia dalseonensis]|uniref:O-antigen/teichoic acid export membrane protein n=1 Tax=Kaistia dalseonensis TaxID=410840 RepID=A0ABU0H203_9HYPH|nr:hypothetical protein [Kaistia dalseonensis]MCX5493771.1 hypothetical protein [Kaistia dalseonensis]MDQ0436335.1 O-antigen/teichoic acid export membrane protein [Kaistia dalseonensis]
MQGTATLTSSRLQFWRRKGGSLPRPIVRILAFADQGFISLANFVITVALARIYPPHDFAGYGIGLAVALTVGGAYRTSFAVPTALLSERRFWRRVRGLAGLHLALIVAMSAIFAIGVVCSFIFSQDDLTQAIALSIFATFPLYLSLDNDRVLSFRSAGPLVPALLSITFFFVSVLLAGAAWLVKIPFPAVMIAFGLFAIGKTAVVCFLPGAPDFRHALLVMAERIKNTVGWVTVGTMASAGYSHVPLWILSTLAAPIHAAAYAAMRSPLQPMQIVVRSLDVVDKITFGKIDPSDRAARRRHAWRTYFIYLGVAIVFMLFAWAFAYQLVHLVLGDTYLPFVSTLRIWAVVFVLVTTSNSLETVIYENRRYKAYAMAQIAGGIVAIAAAFPLSMAYQEAGASFSCFIGSLIPYGWLLWTFNRDLKHQ